jgi:microcystin-dependent protein
MWWADTATGVLKQRDAANAAWVSMFPLAAQPTPTGTLAPFAGRAAPTGWLMAYGQAVSRTTYADLYGVLCPQLGTFTVTVATPGVITLNSHGLNDGERVRLFTTGALPTGLAANTDYFVTASTTNTFQLSATQGGAAINTTGTQSGTHTAQFFGHGAGDGSTTFNLPDMRGRAAVGRDNMGGTAASRLTAAGAGVYGAALGAAGGTETHVLTTPQIPGHTHTYDNAGNAHFELRTTGGTLALGAGGSVLATSDTGVSSTGGGLAHPNVQPTMVTNHIIKT